MSGPTQRTVMVRLHCLQADAASWEQLAADRSEIASSLAAIELGPFEFDVIDEIRVALERARVAIGDAIATSAAQATAIAATLGDAADAYWQDEVANVHAARGIW